MEKISSILPGSSRVTSVDMKESSPVRSGTPSFGRAEAQAGRDRVAPDTLKQASEAQTEMHDWRSKDVKHAAIAKEMSDKFFSKNKTDVEEIMTPSEASGQLSSAGARLAKTQEMLEENDGMHSEIESGIANPESRVQPPGLHPKGSFINYSA